jgi:hypothetical protein
MILRTPVFHLVGLHGLHRDDRISVQKKVRGGGGVVSAKVAQNFENIFAHHQGILLYYCKHWE